MAYIVSLPTKMPNFNVWATAVIQDLKNVPIQSPGKFKDWRAWFNSLRDFTQIGEVPVITKQLYPNDEDWRKAAMQFINNLPVN